MSDTINVVIEDPTGPTIYVVVSEPGTESGLPEHVASTTPHPAYEAIPSLVDLFEEELT